MALENLVAAAKHISNTKLLDRCLYLANCGLHYWGQGNHDEIYSFKGKSFEIEYRVHGRWQPLIRVSVPRFPDLIGEPLNLCLIARGTTPKGNPHKSDLPVVETFYGEPDLFEIELYKEGSWEKDILKNYCLNSKRFRKSHEVIPS